MLAVAVVRNFDRAVGGVVLEELSFTFGSHADHAIGNPTHEDGLAYAIVGRKEVLVDLVADHGDIFPVLVFKVGEKTSLLELDVVDVLVSGSRTRVVEVGDFVRAVTRDLRHRALVEVDPRHHINGHSLYMRTLSDNSLGIIECEWLARALLGRHSPGVDSHIKSEKEQRIGAEVFQIRLHVAAHTHENRGHKDHGGHTDDHAQNRQKRAGLMFPHRLQRHPRVFAKV